MSTSTTERAAPMQHARATQSAPADGAASPAASQNTAPRPAGPFAELGLKGLLLKALDAEGYDTPTPIQAQAIPPVIAGRDLVGIAQTGTGKTAAFALPILQRLFDAKRRAAPRGCLVLVLCPTRELASQIHESFGSYGRFLRVTRALVFGGVPIGKQIRALQSGADVLVATPGRLLDLVQRRAINLSEVETLVLDEADHMLDLGFIHDIRKLVAMLPRQRQNLFFSATMPAPIAALAQELLKDPVRVSVTPAARTVDKIEQSAIIVEAGNKQRLLQSLIGERGMERGIVFCRTKHGADRVAKGLVAAGFSAVAIHGNKSQGQRERALKDLKTGAMRFLIATDIAARGIDVDGLGHVVNFDIPDVPEAYVHRIGRTARAGESGVAIALVAPDEIRSFRDIERTIGRPIEIETHALGTTLPERGARSEGRGGRQRFQPNGQRGGGHHREPRENRGNASEAFSQRPQTRSFGAGQGNGHRSGGQGGSGGVAGGNGQGGERRFTSGSGQGRR